MQIKFPDINSQHVKPQVDRESLELAIERKDKIKLFAENYKAICEDLNVAFQEVAQSFGLDIGQLHIYWVGGRVKGKQIDVDTDVDLHFFVEKSRDMYLNSQAMDALAEGVFNVFKKWDLNISFRKGEMSGIEHKIFRDERIPLFDVSLLSTLHVKRPENLSVYDSRGFPHVQLFPFLQEPEVFRNIVDYLVERIVP